jgi:hypothetical protein
VGADVIHDILYLQQQEIGVALLMTLAPPHETVAYVGYVRRAYCKKETKAEMKSARTEAIEIRLPKVTATQLIRDR